MKAWDGDLLRPLLDTRRKMVIAHLTAMRLPFRSDPSNDDTSFTRNRVRHELMPLLEQRFNPNIVEALGRTARTLAEEHAALREIAAQLLDRAVASAVEGTAFELSVLKAAPGGVGKAALREAVRRFGGLRSVSLVHIEGLWGLVTQGRGGSSLPLPGSRTATVNRGRLVLIGRRPPPAGHSREKPFLS